MVVRNMWIIFFGKGDVFLLTRDANNICYYGSYFVIFEIFVIFHNNILSDFIILVHLPVTFEII